MPVNQLDSPWSILGAPLNGVKSQKDALKKSKLLWAVSKGPLFGRLNDEIIPTGEYGIFRNDNNSFLGKVGKGYEPSQNSSMFEAAAEFMSTIKNSAYDSAGEIFNGERIFVSIRLPEKIRLTYIPHEISHCYVNIETSHDCSITRTAKLMVVRCASGSTLPVSLGIKARHTKGNDGFEVVNVNATISKIKEQFDVLFERKITGQNRDKVIKAMYGRDCFSSNKKRNQISRIIELSEKDNSELRGSAYSLMQAVNYYIDFERPIRKTEKVSGLSENQIRCISANFFDGAQKKESAFQAIIKASSQYSK